MAIGVPASSSFAIRAKKSISSFVSVSSPRCSPVSRCRASSPVSISPVTAESRSYTTGSGSTQLRYERSGEGPSPSADDCFTYRIVSWRSSAQEASPVWWDFTVQAGVRMKSGNAAPCGRQEGSIDQSHPS